MFHPFQSLPRAKLGLYFWRLLAATAVIALVLLLIDLPLRTQAAPYGIVSFEFSGTSAEAENIIQSWDETARLFAAFSLGFDYLFMVSYSTTFALGCVWASAVLAENKRLLYRLGPWLAWSMSLAAALDGVENSALTLLLFGSRADALPGIAWVSASLKFGLLLAGILFCVYGSAARAADKLFKARKSATLS